MMHVIEKFQHLKVPLQAINAATDNFADKNCVGRGGFGKVYKAQLLLSGALTTVALKRLDPKFGQGNPEFWKEIVTLSIYKHPNIVSLLGFCDEKGEKILVYEYASRGSLDSCLNDDALNWIQRLKICIGAARGLAYLHNPGDTHQRVLHRDIKSSNILLDEDWNARIADLGLCKFGPANQQYMFLVSNAVGTIGYCDPLYVESGLLTKESDVYSFGVVLFEVLCGRLSIGNNDDKRRPLTGLVRVHYEQNNMSELIHANIKDEIKLRSLQMFTIAYQCLSIDLKKRPLMASVVVCLEEALQYQYQGMESGATTPLFAVSPQREVNKSIDTLMTPSFSVDKGQQELKRIRQNAKLQALKDLYPVDMRPPEGSNVGDFMECGNWKIQLSVDSRQEQVNRILVILKRHLPYSTDEELQELKRIALSCEHKIYTSATNEPYYLRKIALEMLGIDGRLRDPLVLSKLS